MLLTQIIASSTIPEVLAEYDAKFGPLALAGIFLGGFAFIGGVFAGLMYLAGKVPHKRLSSILSWFAALVSFALLIGGGLLTGNNFDMKHPELLIQNIETVVHDELTAQYRIEDVEIVRRKTAEGTTQGIVHWARTLTDDSLEPSKVIVRMENGPTVPYEVRLVDDKLRLYNLHGDTSVPQPEQILR